MLKFALTFLIAFSLLGFSDSEANPIQVQVLKGKKGVPAAQKTVELLGFAEGSQSVQKKVQTAPNGWATFNVDLKAIETNLVLRVEHQGLQYFSKIFSSTAIPKEPFEIKIYDAKASSNELKIEELRLSIEESLDGALRFQQDLVVSNTGDFTVTGEKERVFDFTLPEGAYDFQILSMLDEKEFKREEEKVTINRPFSPGSHILSFGFSLAPRKAKNFIESASLPIHSVSFMTHIPQVSVDWPDKKMNVLKKFYRGDYRPIFQIPLSPAQKEIRLHMKGLPFHMPWNIVLPIVALLFLFGGTYSMSRKTERIKMPDSAKESLLKELQQLKQLKEWNLIATETYESQRLDKLRQLIPYYASSERPSQ